MFMNLHKDIVNKYVNGKASEEKLLGRFRVKRELSSDVHCIVHERK